MFPNRRQLSMFPTLYVIGSCVILNLLSSGKYQRIKNTIKPFKSRKAARREWISANEVR